MRVYLGNRRSGEMEESFVKGLQIGDLFEIRRPIDDDRGVLVPVVVGRGRVVHVGQNTATLKVVLVTGPDIPVGSETVQIAKMP